MNFIRALYALGCIAISLWAAQLIPANIIFDLGGVLLRPNKSAVARQAGVLNLACYAIKHMKNPRVAFFNILQDITPFTDIQIKPCDETGSELPGIMCDWLKGIPTKKIRTKIEQRISSMHPLSGLVQAIFEPKLMASSQKLIDEGVHFVQECIEQGHCVYILSNWDAESFTYLLEKYPDFFGLFSGIIISGDCGLLKPDPAIYHYLLFEYKLDPSTCFFIDNQQENVQAAATIGIAGSVAVEYKSKLNFASVRQDLHAWLNSQTQPV